MVLRFIVASSASDGKRLDGDHLPTMTYNVNDLHDPCVIPDTHD